MATIADNCHIQGMENTRHHDCSLLEQWNLRGAERAILALLGVLRIGLLGHWLDC